MSHKHVIMLSSLFSTNPGLVRIQSIKFLDSLLLNNIIYNSSGRSLNPMIGWKFSPSLHKTLLLEETQIVVMLEPVYANSQAWTNFSFILAMSGISILIYHLHAWPPDSANPTLIEWSDMVYDICTKHVLPLYWLVVRCYLFPMKCSPSQVYRQREQSEVQFSQPCIYPQQERMLPVLPTEQYAEWNC